MPRPSVSTELGSLFIVSTNTCSAPFSVLVGLAMETHSVKAVSAAVLSLPPDGSEVKKWGLEGNGRGVTWEMGSTGPV